VQPTPHLGRVHHGEVVVEVVVPERTQDEAIGLDGRTGTHTTSVPRSRGGITVGLLLDCID
ncbi:uncharacterized protein METZ01_LOCUS182068, partial [marine metagenome]